MGLLSRKKLGDVESGEAAASAAAAPRGVYTIDEHLLSPREVAQRFGTHVEWMQMSNSKGLTSQQAKEQQEKYGLNQLTPPKERSEIVKFLLQFTNPLMALLLVAGGLTFMAYALQVGLGPWHAVWAYSPRVLCWARV
jgi:magnesium-transporting ATPase (P-type)